MMGGGQCLRLPCIYCRILGHADGSLIVTVPVNPFKRVALATVATADRGKESSISVMAAIVFTFVLPVIGCTTASYKSRCLFGKLLCK
jgi:hypothetical protein